MEDTIEMLRGLKDRYEAHHGVRITDEALRMAAVLSDRYVKDRHLPDKAIDLIDEAGSKAMIAIHSLPPHLKELRQEIARLATEDEAAGQERNYALAADVKSQRLKLTAEFDEARTAWQEQQGLDEVVDAEDVAGIVSSWTGIPVSRMQEAETARLLEMEEHLKRYVVGQEDAIAAVADAIRRARSGLKDPRRPIGSFIFLGSSGVGKTELAKALARFLFDSEDALLQVDMTEYGERHTVSRLVGAPPGYVGYDEGGQLTEAVRRRPYQVILFDEIEKAHADVWNALMRSRGGPADRWPGAHGGFPQHGAHHDLEHRHVVRQERRRDRLSLRHPALRGGPFQRRHHAGAQADLPARVPEPHRRGDHL